MTGLANMGVLHDLDHAPLNISSSFNKLHDL